MIDPEARLEAQTNWPQMMDGVARVTQHGRQKRLILTIAHSAAGGLRAAFVALTRFLREVRNAPQLTPIKRWCRILGSTLRKYFREKYRIRHRGCCRPESEPAQPRQATNSSQPEGLRVELNAESSLIVGRRPSAAASECTSSVLMGLRQSWLRATGSCVSRRTGCPSKASPTELRLSRKASCSGMAGISPGSASLENPDSFLSAPGRATDAETLRVSGYRRRARPVGRAQFLTHDH